MPWIEETVKTQRKELVSLAGSSDPEPERTASVAELSRRFKVSRRTAYKWIGRKEEGGDNWAEDRSRRPKTSPGKCDAEVEAAVLAVRTAHPAWGGRKIRRVLQNKGQPAPAASTITAILRRNDAIDPKVSREKGPMVRFERETPNELWQMDFKGRIPTAAGEVHPLVVEDDHSRYALGIVACQDQREPGVKDAMTAMFRLHGLPLRMLMDNGSCWGVDEKVRHTFFTAWLVRLGIAISHGRIYHPQTQGKCERLNRTLGIETLAGRNWKDAPELQRALDAFRHCYNHERPHEALGLDTPSRFYRVSPLPFPETLPPILYLDGDIVRKVGPAGYLSYAGDRFQVGRAFTGFPVGLRHTDIDGVFDVHFCSQRVAVIDRRDLSCHQV